MHIGSQIHPIGRFVVDIDNSLRATDCPHITARDILALHGEVDPGAAVIWETDGQSILLALGDRIEMDEHRVDFFRTVAAGPLRCTTSTALAGRPTRHPTFDTAIAA